MSSSPPGRGVKISDDERGAWSSDRPRSGNAPRRPADISVRGRVLRPTDALRYAPGSLLLIVSPSREERERFAERLIRVRGALLSPEKVAGLLTGRVPAEEIPARADELLEATVAKRLAAGETVVLTLEGLEPEERDRWARLAATSRRPRHLILLEVGRDQVDDDRRSALNDLRRRLDAGELGQEGFHSALRLSGVTAGELKRIVFAPAPKDD